jgi:hypothetical protein
MPAKASSGKIPPRDPAIGGYSHPLLRAIRAASMRFEADETDGVSAEKLSTQPRQEDE